MNTRLPASLSWLLLMLGAHAARIRRGRDRGASAIEFVIVVAILAMFAVVMGVVVYKLISGSPESVDVPDTTGDL